MEVGAINLEPLAVLQARVVVALFLSHIRRQMREGRLQGLMRVSDREAAAVAVIAEIRQRNAPEAMVARDVASSGSTFK